MTVVGCRDCSSIPVAIHNYFILLTMCWCLVIILGLLLLSTKTCLLLAVAAAAAAAPLIDLPYSVLLEVSWILVT